MNALIKLRAKQLRRAPLHFLIRNTVQWKPLLDPAPGYTVVMGCMKSLVPIAIANLALCARQACPGMHELLMVFDCPPEEIPAEVIRAAEDASGSIRVRLLGYNRHQYRIARLINWGWVYCWMSWAVAIAEVRTRAVIVHDLDALPLEPGLFEQLHDQWVEEGAEFCGIHPYLSHGITEEMGLVATYEMVLDAGFVRQRFRPFDLYNRLLLVDGRVIDYDTMLFVQLTARRALRPIEESQFVHPSQLICNYNDLVAGRSHFRGRSNTLPMLPYYFYLGGEGSQLASVGAQLAAGETPADRIQLLGHDLYIDGIRPQSWAYFEKLIRRTDQVLYQRTRPEVEAYLTGFIRRAGSHRTVGREVGSNAVREY